LTILINTRQDQYGKKSDLQINDNEEINTWDILVDKGVYIFPIALVNTYFFDLIVVVFSLIIFSSQ
jgi:hypothetical protein